MLPRSGGLGGLVQMAEDFRQILQAKIESFLARSGPKGIPFSVKTRQAYSGHLSQFLEQITEDPEVVSLASLTERLGDYRRWLQEDKYASPHSQRQALSAVRSFLKWLDFTGDLKLRLRDLQRLSSQRVTAPTFLKELKTKEIATLLASAQTEKERLLIHLMVGAGLRSNEVRRLRASDVHLVGGEQVVLALHSSKNESRRQVVLPRAVGAKLDAYRRTKQLAGLLFEGGEEESRGRRHPGHPLTAQGLNQLVKRVAKRAGLDFQSLAPKDLRDTFVLRELRSGQRSEQELRSYLGLASPDSLRRYLRHMRESPIQGGS